MLCDVVGRYRRLRLIGRLNWRSRRNGRRRDRARRDIGRRDPVSWRGLRLCVRNGQCGEHTGQGAAAKLLQAQSPPSCPAWRPMQRRRTPSNATCPSPLTCSPGQNSSLQSTPNRGGRSLATLFSHPSAPAHAATLPGGAGMRVRRENWIDSLSSVPPSCGASATVTTVSEALCRRCHPGELDKPWFFEPQGSAPKCGCRSFSNAVFRKRRRSRQRAS